MLEYYIAYITDNPIWNQIPKTDIRKFCWRTEYRPISYAQLTWRENHGLLVRMVSYESNPVSRWTNNDELVWEDSCMEFFVNFDPLHTDSYLNYEVNHNGVVLIQHGACGTDRRFVVPEYGMSYPDITSFKGEDSSGFFWGIEYTILLPQILIPYPGFQYRSEGQLKGNFFKCGEKTGRPHYGSWTDIIYDIPAFHKPEYFGNLIFK